jgi:mRNA interferase RelE/StbE
MYRIRILESAARELGRLDKPVGRRVSRRINWLAENLDDLQPEALTGDLAGLFKLRAGDYRILYEILREEQTITIHLIGHRREIYRRQ